MLVNNAVSAGVGLVPIVGDIILAMYKANSRNAALLEEYLRVRGEEFLKPEGQRKQNAKDVKPGAGRKQGEVIPIPGEEPLEPSLGEVAAAPAPGSSMDTRGMPGTGLVEAARTRSTGEVVLVGVVVVGVEVVDQRLRSAGVHSSPRAPASCSGLPVEAPAARAVAVGARHLCPAPHCWRSMPPGTPLSTSTPATNNVGWGIHSDGRPLTCTSLSARPSSTC